MSRDTRNRQSQRHTGINNALPRIKQAAATTVRKKVTSSCRQEQVGMDVQSRDFAYLRAAKPSLVHAARAPRFGITELRYCHARLSTVFS
jgi:hypothetical protein